MDTERDLSNACSYQTASPCAAEYCRISSSGARQANPYTFIRDFPER